VQLHIILAALEGFLDEDIVQINSFRQVLLVFDLNIVVKVVRNVIKFETLVPRTLHRILTLDENALLKTLDDVNPIHYKIVQDNIIDLEESCNGCVPIAADWVYLLSTLVACYHRQEGITDLSLNVMRDSYPAVCSTVGVTEAWHRGVR
jgi:hypothetical protein